VLHSMCSVIGSTVVSTWYKIVEGIATTACSTVGRS
jgi:hypothetical protein